MAEFVMEKAVKESGEVFQVHLLGCAQVTDPNGAYYIGSFATPVAAYNIAAGLKYSPEYCPECLSKMIA